MTDVFMNEKFVGNVEKPLDFVANIREERRSGKLPSVFNIYYDKDYDEIIISTSKGRSLRPLIVVTDGKSRLTKEHLIKLERNEMTWKELVSQGIIEYLDAAEEENAYISLYEEDLNKDHTHMEINPIVILGLITCLVPYANYSQSSRLNRGSKTQKQGLGLYASNYLMRMDTDINIMAYPQTPIVRTFMHDILSYDKHPSGQNVVVAVMCYEGQNMQDAIVLNQGSVQRGLGRSFYYRPYNSEELRYQGGLMDEIGLPDKEVKGYRSEKEYRFLEEDGIVYPEAKLNTDEVIIGKTSPPRFLSELEEFSIAASTRRESSEVVRHGETGTVDMVIVTENDEGNRLVQVRLRDQRIPEPGDKFSSRHGQKGVIGAIIPQADMPFTASGIIPDLLFSPHGIPSRMTISHLLEMLAGKTGAMSGRYVDGTIFEGEKEEKLRKELKALGFRDNGTERMYNGITGEEFDVNIYIGDMYYMKLKYMVANKLHARASGRIQLLTRQPIEGRSKGGGLRLGEMEKDCFVAHGTSLLLKERFDSDKTVLYVCESCGMFAVHDLLRKRSFCPKCGSNVEISAVELSYAFKLLLDELKALGVYPRLNLKSKY